MGIIGKLKSLFSANAPMTSGATKAAVGQSDLTDIVDSLDELRGENVTAADSGQPSADKMQNIAEAGRDAGMFNIRGGTDIVGQSDSYRSSK